MCFFFSTGAWSWLLSKTGLLASTVPCSPAGSLCLWSLPDSPVNVGGVTYEIGFLAEHKLWCFVMGFMLNFKEHPSLFETWHTFFISMNAGFK